MVGAVVGSLCMWFIGGYLTGAGIQTGENAAKRVGDYFGKISLSFRTTGFSRLTH